MHVIVIPILIYINFYNSKYKQYKYILGAWIIFCVTWFDKFCLRMEKKNTITLLCMKFRDCVVI